MDRPSPLSRHFATGRRSTNVTTNQSAIEVRAGTVKGITIWRVKIDMAAATASVFALGRPAAIGVTPTTPEALVPMTDVSDSAPLDGVARSALAWATSPTPPTIAVERVNLAATIGASQVVRFDHGYYIPAGSSFVVQNVGTTGVVDVTVEISE